MGFWTRWTEKAGAEAGDVRHLSACRDPRSPGTGGPGRVRGGLRFSPIDLIPDPVPILGYLDDLVLIPLGIAIVSRASRRRHG